MGMKINFLIEDFSTSYIYYPKNKVLFRVQKEPFLQLRPCLALIGSGVQLKPTNLKVEEKSTTGILIGFKGI